MINVNSHQKTIKFKCFSTHNQFMNVTVEIDGYIRAVIETLIEKGIVKTKAEAVRLGILGLNDKYHVMEEEKILYEIANKAREDINSGKSKLVSEKEFLEKFPHLKSVKDD